MKKRLIAPPSLEVVACLMLSLVAVLPAAALPAPIDAPAAGQAAGAQQSGAPKGPQWKSRDEYDAFQAISKETDPHKKIALAQAFIQKYANSDYKGEAYALMIQSYAQTNDFAKLMQTAADAAKAAPDSLDVDTAVSYFFPLLYKGDDPNKDADLAAADSYAKNGLALVEKLQKPANATEEQFNQSVKARRAIFNGAIGFVALQKKDYATAITALNSAKGDNPSDTYTFYRLGLAYLYSTPPDFDHAIWNLARATSLAKAAKAPDSAAIEKYFSQVYVSRHGSDAGETDVETQAATAVEPPADFKVAPAPKHATTGNQFIDAFYSYEDNLKVGGDTETRQWDALKGQPFAGPGYVDNVAPGTDPGTYLVHIDITDDSKAKDGVYDIELKDSQPGCKDLSKGDPVRFQGTVSAYTATPSFVLTLDNGKINDDDLAAAAAARKSEKPARPTRSTPRRPVHRTQGR
jgi:hypothetical protein